MKGSVHHLISRSRRARLLVGFAPVLAAAVATAAPTHSAAAPKRTLAHYCSQTHEVCLRIVERNGTVFFSSAFERHFARYYRLCVQASGSGAAGLRRCGSYPLLRRASGTWGSSVDYRNYPPGEAGWVRVTWSDGAKRLGPTLRFKLPLSR